MENVPADCSRFRLLCDRQLLGPRLVQVAERKKLENVLVGLLIDEQQFTFEIRGATHDVNGRSTSQQSIHAGCLAKLLTATLVAELVANSQLDWSDKIVDSLMCQHSTRRKLRDIAVCHLLNHSHGLHGESVDALPRSSDGFISVHRLCEFLSDRRLSKPGALYSYGEIGSWLAGALIEHIYQKPYADVLLDRGLMVPQSLHGDHAPEFVCPATGRELQLTVAQWFSFAQLHFDNPTTNSRNEPFAVLRDMQIQLPGWHPTERAMCLGWKYYGDGWYGHNSKMSDRSAVLRINPLQRVAIIVSVEGSADAIIALAGLFGDLLPEFLHLRFPRLVGSKKRRDEECDRYLGVYSQSTMKVTVRMSADSGLELSIYDLRAERCVAHSRLRAASEGVFILEWSGDSDFLFVQFLAPRREDEIEYLWNGRQLWLKE